MKKWAVVISAVGLAFAVSGCSSDYVMATKDGRMILTDGKPQVDDDTGLVSYTDTQETRCKSTVTKCLKSSNVKRWPVIEVSVLQAFRLRPVTVRGDHAR